MPLPRALTVAALCLATTATGSWLLLRQPAPAPAAPGAPAPGHGEAAVLACQDATARFDRTGMTMRAADGRWRAAVQLEHIGRTTQLHAVAAIPAQQATPDVAEYDRGDHTEWYRSDAGAIEQGVTFHVRPEGAGELALDYRIDLGDAQTLAPNSLLFRDTAGAPALLVDQLIAYDRDGDLLPARMQATDGRLSIRVDDRGADYPVTIDPTYTGVADGALVLGVGAARVEASGAFSYVFQATYLGSHALTVPTGDSTLSVITGADGAPLPAPATTFNPGVQQLPRATIAGDLTQIWTVAFTRNGAPATAQVSAGDVGRKLSIILENGGYAERSTNTANLPGRRVARFGYLNPLPYALTIPVGARNRILGPTGLMIAQQPTTFQLGRVRNAAMAFWDAASAGTITYQLHGKTATASVARNQPRANVRPTVTLAAASATIAPGGTASIVASIADIDAADTRLLVTASRPAHGVVAPAQRWMAPGRLTLRYTPAAGFTGTDTFTIVADDGFGPGIAQTVTVTVQAPAGEIALTSTGARGAVANLSASGDGNRVVTVADRVVSLRTVSGPGAGTVDLALEGPAFDAVISNNGRYVAIVSDLYPPSFGMSLYSLDVIDLNAPDAVANPVSGSGWRWGSELDSYEAQVNQLVGISDDGLVTATIGLGTAARIITRESAYHGEWLYAYLAFVNSGIGVSAPRLTGMDATGRTIIALDHRDGDVDRAFAIDVLSLTTREISLGADGASLPRSAPSGIAFAPGSATITAATISPDGGQVAYALAEYLTDGSGLRTTLYRAAPGAAAAWSLVGTANPIGTRDAALALSHGGRHLFHLVDGLGSIPGAVLDTVSGASAVPAPQLGRGSNRGIGVANDGSRAHFLTPQALTVQDHNGNSVDSYVRVLAWPGDG